MANLFDRKANSAAAAAAAAAAGAGGGGGGGRTPLDELLEDETALDADFAAFRNSFGLKLDLVDMKLRQKEGVLANVRNGGQEMKESFLQGYRKLQKYRDWVKEQLQQPGGPDQGRQQHQQQQAQHQRVPTSQPWSSSTGPSPAPTEARKVKSREWREQAIGESFEASRANAFRAATGGRASQDFTDLQQDPDHFHNNPAAPPKVQRGAVQGTSRGAKMLGFAVPGARPVSKSQPAFGPSVSPPMACDFCLERCHESALKPVMHGKTHVEAYACGDCCKSDPNVQPKVQRKGADAFTVPKLKAAPPAANGVSHSSFYGDGLQSGGYQPLHLERSTACAGGPTAAGSGQQGVVTFQRKQPGQRQKQQPQERLLGLGQGLLGLRKGERGTSSGQQRSAQQGQQRRKKRNSDDSDYEPSAADAAKAPRHINGRPKRTQRAAAAKQKDDGRGTEDNPILLSDDDDQAAPAAAAAKAGPSRLGRVMSWRSTSQKFEGLRCLFPPPGAAGESDGAVEVTALDLARLDDQEFLNDTVIDFYLRWLRQQLERRLGPEAASRCYFFNSFFYKKLTENNPSSLSDELVKYAKEEMGWGSGSPEWQALRNHQKVKNWTKGVDIFSKDYLVVPIHESLHWSLAIVCHPGAEPGLEGEQTPCILHLDSMNGGHLTPPMVETLRMYLTNEWNLKAVDSEAKGRPWEWRQQHANQWRNLNNDQEMPSIRLKLPIQGNFCDCGLFLLTYAEFFIHKLPPGMNSQKLEALIKDARKKDRQDLFEDSHGFIPGFLTPGWFEPTNASNLRNELRRMLLRLMAEQGGYLVDMVRGAAGVGPPRPPEWPAGEVQPGTELLWSEEEGKKEMARRLKDELEKLDGVLRESRHMRPDVWMTEARSRKEKRLARLEKEAEREAAEARAAEEKREERARRRSQGAAAAGGQQGAPSRNVLAAAAEARAQRPHGASLAEGGDGAGSQPVEEELEAGAQQGLPASVDPSQEDFQIRLTNSQDWPGSQTPAPESLVADYHASDTMPEDSDEGAAGTVCPAAAAAVFPPAATATTTATGRRKRQRASLNRAAAAPPAIHLLREDGPDIDVSAAAVAAAAVARQEQPSPVQDRAEPTGLDRDPSGEEGVQGRRVRRRSRRGGGEQRGGLVQPGDQSARDEEDQEMLLTGEGEAPVHVPAAQQAERMGQQQQQQHVAEHDVVDLVSSPPCSAQAPPAVRVQHPSAAAKQHNPQPQKKIKQGESSADGTVEQQQQPQQRPGRQRRQQQPEAGPGDANQPEWSSSEDEGGGLAQQQQQRGHTQQQQRQEGHDAEGLGAALGDTLFHDYVPFLEGSGIEAPPAAVRSRQQEGGGTDNAHRHLGGGRDAGCMSHAVGGGRAQVQLGAQPDEFEFADGSQGEQCCDPGEGPEPDWTQVSRHNFHEVYDQHVVKLVLHYQGDRRADERFFHRQQGETDLVPARARASDYLEQHKHLLPPSYVHPGSGNGSATPHPDQAAAAGEVAAPAAAAQRQQQQHQQQQQQQQERGHEGSLDLQQQHQYPPTQQQQQQGRQQGQPARQVREVVFLGSPEVVDLHTEEAEEEQATGAAAAETHLANVGPSNHGIVEAAGAATATVSATGSPRTAAAAVVGRRELQPCQQHPETGGDDWVSEFVRKASAAPEPANPTGGGGGWEAEAGQVAAHPSTDAGPRAQHGSLEEGNQWQHGQQQLEQLGSQESNPDAELTEGEEEVSIGCEAGSPSQPQPKPFSSLPQGPPGIQASELAAALCNTAAAATLARSTLPGPSVGGLVDFAKRAFANASLRAAAAASPAPMEEDVDTDADVREGVGHISLGGPEPAPPAIRLPPQQAQQAQVDLPRGTLPTAPLAAVPAAGGHVVDLTGEGVDDHHQPLQQQDPLHHPLQLLAPGAPGPLPLPPSALQVQPPYGERPQMPQYRSPRRVARGRKGSVPARRPQELASPDLLDPSLGIGMPLEAATQAAAPLARLPPAPSQRQQEQRQGSAAEGRSAGGGSMTGHRVDNPDGHAVRMLRSSTDTATPATGRGAGASASDAGPGLVLGQPAKHVPQYSARSAPPQQQQQEHRKHFWWAPNGEPAEGLVPPEPILASCTSEEPQHAPSASGQTSQQAVTAPQKPFAALMASPPWAQQEQRQKKRHHQQQQQQGSPQQQRGMLQGGAARLATETAALPVGIATLPQPSQPAGKSTVAGSAAKARQELRRGGSSSVPEPAAAAAEQAQHPELATSTSPGAVQGQAPTGRDSGTPASAGQEAHLELELELEEAAEVGSGGWQADQEPSQHLRSHQQQQGPAMAGAHGNSSLSGGICSSRHQSSCRAEAGTEHVGKVDDSADDVCVID